MQEAWSILSNEIYDLIGVIHLKKVKRDIKDRYRPDLLKCLSSSRRQTKSMKTVAEKVLAVLKAIEDDGEIKLKPKYMEALKKRMLSFCR